jgi:nucleotide-binding universal stress UspA family protein
MYASVLVPLDLHDPGDCGRIIATVTGLLATQGAAVHLLTVLPYDEALGPARQFIPDDFVAGLRKEAAGKLDALAEKVRGAGLDCAGHVASGNPYVETLAAAEAHKADLIVIGAGRAELKDYLIGPSAARIMRHAECSVLVVRS